MQGAITIIKIVGLFQISLRTHYLPSFANLEERKRGLFKMVSSKAASSEEGEAYAPYVEPSVQ